MCLTAIVRTSRLSPSPSLVALSNSTPKTKQVARIRASTCVQMCNHAINMFVCVGVRVCGSAGIRGFVCACWSMCVHKHVCCSNRKCDLFCVAVAPVFLYGRAVRLIELIALGVKGLLPLDRHHTRREHHRRLGFGVVQPSGQPSVSAGAQSSPGCTIRTPQAVARRRW